MLINRPGAELIEERALKIMQALKAVETSMTGRQVARVTNSPKSKTITVLNNLVKIGVLRANPTGNALAYEANKNHFYWHILNLLNNFHQELREKLVSIMPEELRGYNHKSALFLFGSVSRNQSTLESDIDLGIIVPDEAHYQIVKQQVQAARQGIEEFTGNELSAFIVTWQQFCSMVKARDPLVSSWEKDAEHLSGEYVEDLRTRVLLEEIDEVGIYA